MNKKIYAYKEESEDNKFLEQFPIAIIVTIIYLLLGFYGKLWHPGWVVFMLIPVYYSIIKALPGRENRKMKRN